MKSDTLLLKNLYKQLQIIFYNRFLKFLFHQIYIPLIYLAMYSPNHHITLLLQPLKRIPLNWEIRYNK